MVADKASATTRAASLSLPRISTRMRVQESRGNHAVLGVPQHCQRAQDFADHIRKAGYTRGGYTHCHLHIVQQVFAGA